MHLCGGHAEPERLSGEITARLLGADRSRLADAVAGVEVPQARDRQRPAIARRRQEPGQDGEQRRVAVAVDRGLDPAVRLGHVRRSPPGQRPVHLEVGMLAGKQPAQHLEDRRVAEGQAGVALLAGHHQAVCPAIDDRPGLPGEAERADGQLLADAAQQDPGEHGIVQGVVGRPAGAGRPDDGAPQLLGYVLADAGQDLVPGGLAVLEYRDDQVPQPGVTGGQRGVGRYREVSDRGAGARVPPLGRQPRR